MRSLSTCGLRRAAGFGLLACLATAPAAYAQGLTVGSLSGTPPGTAVVGAAGTTASGTCAYTGGASASTKAYNSVDEYAGQFTLNQGGSVTALTTYYLDPSLPNPSNSAAGFNITGGNVTTIDHASQGTGVISGGTVGSITEAGFPDCTLDISGGTVKNLNMYAAAGTNGATPKTQISGGSIQSISSAAGNLLVTGGSVDTLTVGNLYTGHGFSAASITSINGGSINSINVSGHYDTGDAGFPFINYDTCNLNGGILGTLTASNYGGFDVFGTDLHLTQAGYITGFLFDGTAIDSAYTNADGLGFLEFNGVAVPAAVPEASTTISLGLLLTLGLGGIALTKRRRQAA